MSKQPLEPEVLPADLPHGLPLGHAERVRRVRRVARLMDEAIRIPGTNYRIGWDAVIGLVPAVGDVATAAVAAWIVREAAQLGLPRYKLAHMIGNILVDMAAGSIPLVGDLVDVAFKANKKNLAILERHLETLRPRDAGVSASSPATHSPQRHRARILD